MALTAALVGSRGTTGGTSITTTAGTSASSATFLALVSYDATAGTITTAGDNKGNSYTPIGTAQSDTAGGLLRWYVCENGTGGSSHTFTFTTSSNNYGVAHLFQITSDAGGIARLDINVQGQDTVGQPWDAVATGTLNYADEVILAAVACNSNGGSSAAYTSSNTTILSSEGDCASFWTSGVGALNQSATTSFTPAFSKSDAGGSSQAGMSHVTFREEAGSGSAISAAAGTSTAGTLAGSSTAASAVSSAAGVTTAATLAGSDANSTISDVPVGTFDPELVPVAWHMVEQVPIGWFDERFVDPVVASGQAAINPAAGVTTAGSLAGTSVAATAAASAAGISTVGTLVGSAIVAAAMVAASGVSTASTVGGSALKVAAFASQPTAGVHTLYWEEEANGADPATTGAINTQATGSSLVVFTAGYASNTGGPADTYSNTWTHAGTEVYTGWSGVFDVRGYYVEVASGGSGHTVTFQKDGQPAGEITIPFVEIKNAGTLVDYAQNYPAAGTALTSGSVTTTGPALLVAFWWGDAGGLTHDASPNNGFTLIEEFGDLPPNSAVQCFVAVKEVTAAGTYDVTWTETPDQGAPLWLFAFQGQGGATGTSTTGTLAGAALKTATVTGASGASTAGTLAGTSVAAAAVTQADGTSAAATVAGASTAAATVTQADGVSTTGSLTGSGGTGSAIAQADGVSTTGTLTGSSTAATAATQADGVATAGALSGASTAAASLTAAAGVSTAETLTGVAGSGSVITQADGTATTGTLTGSSVAAGALGQADGAATAGSLAGASTAAATVSAAAGAATGETLTGVAGSGSVISAAAGVSTAGTLVGTSSAATVASQADGSATVGTLAGASTAAATVSSAPGASTASTITATAVRDAAITGASGAATAGTLAGGAVAAATATQADGAASAGALAGTSVAASTVAPAAGVTTAATMVGADGAIYTPGRITLTDTAVTGTTLNSVSVTSTTLGDTGTAGLTITDE